jgi:glucuronokinase
MVVEAHAYARAGLLGNPSDGYYGRIVAVTVGNFSARVSLEESKRIVILPSDSDGFSYENMASLAEDVRIYGYYGGVRLIKAGVKRFFEYCQNHEIRLHPKNFTLRYSSDIPRQLGLGGSSAIITAAMRALASFYRVDIPLEILPTLILEAETEELGINAGFMDRVIQVYEGCMYMDLDRQLIESRGYGQYERLDPRKLPSLYLAYQPALGKVSGRVLNPIREAVARGDRMVLECLRRLAAIADEGKAAIEQGDRLQLHGLMNENFDLRSRIMPISQENQALIRTARSCGASAKFAGSGGSIIGVYKDDTMFATLTSKLRNQRAIVIKPEVK